MKTVIIILLCVVYLVFSALVYHFSIRWFEYPPYFFYYCCCCALSVSFICFSIKMNRNSNAAHLLPEPKPRCNKKWACALFAFALLFFTGLASLLSTAWLKGDDFFSSTLNNIGLQGRFFAAIDVYSHHVSRNGDFIVRLAGLAENRWQQWLITPLVVLLIPYGLQRLVGSGRESMCSMRGMLFFVFVSFLALLSCQVYPQWRNYWCWAACVNYLYPTVACFYFLSFYRQQYEIDCRTSKIGWLKMAGMFCLGFYACSGPECLDIVLLPLLIVYLVAKWMQKKYIPWGNLMGVLGAVWGFFFVFASPALQRRRAGGELLPFDALGLDDTQKWEFVQHLTWDKMLLLTDSSSVINLGSIPLWLHCYFVPWLLERYFQCCMFAFGAFAILLIFIVLKKEPGRRKKVCISLLFPLVGLVSALAYLQSCIPTSMSFLPPSFVVLIGAAWLFVRLPYRWFPQLFMCLLAMAAAVFLLAPPGIEAWNYKKYEAKRAEAIMSQKQQGMMDVVVPPLFPQAPQDKLGLIGGGKGGLNADPSGYPNHQAACQYGVKTISQK